MTSVRCATQSEGLFRKNGSQREWTDTLSVNRVSAMVGVAGVCTMRQWMNLVSVLIFMVTTVGAESVRTVRYVQLTCEFSPKKKKRKKGW